MRDGLIWGFGGDAVWQLTLPQLTLWTYGGHRIEKRSALARMEKAFGPLPR